MRDINEPCGDNVGGINSFEFIPVSDIDTYPDLFNGKLIKQITLVEGARWFKGYGTYGTIGFTEDPIDSPNGTSFNASLKAVVPKEQSENEALYFEMRNLQFVVKYKNNNGLVKIIGSPTEPLKFSFGLVTGTDLPNRNQHNIEFKGETTRPAVVYSI